jgi:hypothetical protein
MDSSSSTDILLAFFDKSPAKYKSSFKPSPLRSEKKIPCKNGVEINLDLRYTKNEHYKKNRKTIPNILKKYFHPKSHGRI